jgi:hypothetical protein
MRSHNECSSVPQAEALSGALPVVSFASALCFAQLADTSKSDDSDEEEDVEDPELGF